MSDFAQILICETKKPGINFTGSDEEYLESISITWKSVDTPIKENISDICHTEKGNLLLITESEQAWITNPKCTIFHRVR